MFRLLSPDVTSLFSVTVYMTESRYSRGELGGREQLQTTNLIVKNEVLLHLDR